MKEFMNYTLNLVLFPQPGLLKKKTKTFIPFLFPFNGISDQYIWKYANKKGYLF